VYDATTLPQEQGWAYSGPQGGPALEIDGGKTVLASKVDNTAGGTFWMRSWKAKADAGYTVAFRVKMLAGRGIGANGVIISDGAHGDFIQLLSTGISTYYDGFSDGVMPPLDGEFHDYQAAVIGTDILFYIDGKLAVEGRGRFTNRDLWGSAVGFGHLSSNSTGDARWAYVKYTAQGAFDPDGRAIEPVNHEWSPLYGASYLDQTGTRMIRLDLTLNENLWSQTVHAWSVSDDNGKTWTTSELNPTDRELPKGFRRDAFPIFVDRVNGCVVRIIPSLDIPGLDPNIVEPPDAQNAYYLRYQVSIDGGRTYLYDKVLHAQGFDDKHPCAQVYTDKNGLFLGDVGSVPIRTAQGKIIVPAQAQRLDTAGKLTGIFDVYLFIGAWQPDHDLTWECVRIEADPAVSARGMIEPALLEMPDGRILCVMRGSGGGAMPSYKWLAVSTDGGYTWSKPAPWTFDDDSHFFSPSSMSALIRHSSGRCFWIGNISAENAIGNGPRYPLWIGEIDPKTLRLIKGSLIKLDDKKPAEKGVNLSHFWTFEDRMTREIVIVSARWSWDYRTNTPVVYRVLPAPK